MSNKLEVIWPTTLGSLPKSLKLNGEDTDIFTCLGVLFSEIERLEALIAQPTNKETKS